MSFFWYHVLIILFNICGWIKKITQLACIYSTTPNKLTSIVSKTWKIFSKKLPSSITMMIETFYLRKEKVLEKLNITQSLIAFDLTSSSRASNRSPFKIISHGLDNVSQTIALCGGWRITGKPMRSIAAAVVNLQCNDCFREHSVVAFFVMRLTRARTNTRKLENCDRFGTNTRLILDCPKRRTTKATTTGCWRQRSLILNRVLQLRARFAKNTEFYQVSNTHNVLDSINTDKKTIKTWMWSSLKTSFFLW